MTTRVMMLQKSDLHLLRKFWHVFTGLLVLSLYLSMPISSGEMGFFVVCFGLAALAFDVVRLKVPLLNQFSQSVFCLFMRECEKNSLSGLPFYALGSGFTLYFFAEPFAILSILFLIFADPIASIFGVSFGRTKVWGDKSFEGTMASFVTCFSIVMIYGLMYFPVGINLFIFASFSALIGCLSELSLSKLDDNLVIPVLSGAGMTLMNYFVPMV